MLKDEMDNKIWLQFLLRDPDEIVSTSRSRMVIVQTVNFTHYPTAN